MSKVQKWGREESIIWPPRGFYYTYGAIFLAVLVAGFLVYVRFAFGLSPLEKYYLPYYLRTDTAGLMHQRSEYQLIYVLNDARDTRLALDSDVQTGQSPQVVGKALPFQLSAQALQKGDRFLWRESLRSYQNKALHDFLARWIYSGASLFSLFETPLAVWGVRSLPAATFLNPEGRPTSAATTLWPTPQRPSSGIGK